MSTPDLLELAHRRLAEAREARIHAEIIARHAAEVLILLQQREAEAEKELEQTKAQQ